MNSPNEAESSLPDEAAGGESRAPKKLGDLQKAITMAQIAKAAGVSQGAISSLLNDRDYGIRVSEKTRERVFKVCREMGYVPNDLRAVVRMYPELGDCCLLVPTSLAPGLADPQVSRIAGAILSAVSDPLRAVTVALYEEGRDYATAPEALPQPVRAGICSKFIVLGSASRLLLQALKRRGSSAICLGHDAALPGVVSILPDYVQASRLAIKHLFHLGHRQIGIVSGPFGATDPRLLELNRGIGLACSELGLSLDAGMIVHGDLSEKSGESAAGELLTRSTAPSAIFCLSDAAAIGALAGTHARGLGVPRQVSVVGCGDDPCASSAFPALTTVHLPLEAMARLAVQEIERLVRGSAPAEARCLVQPVSLAERKSTALATAD